MQTPLNDSFAEVEGSISLNDYFQIGRELVEKELFAEGAAIFRYLIFKHPTASWSWYWLVVCHRGLGQPDVAAQLSEVAAGNCGPAFFKLAAVSWQEAGDELRATRCHELGAAQ